MVPDGPMCDVLDASHRATRWLQHFLTNTPLKKKKAQVRKKRMLVPHFQFPISPSEDFYHISRIYLGHTAMCKLLFVIENENTTADSYRTRFSLNGCPCSLKDITLALIKVSEVDY